MERRSWWVNSEIELALEELERRGVDVIPVRVAPADPPSALADRQVLDLSAGFDQGLRQLVDQVRTSRSADFATLDYRAFENLVADLLVALGFNVERGGRRSRDPGYDLIAVHERRNPLGRVERETWLVECKLYRHQRVSVESIRQLAGVVATNPPGTRGLFVTNSQITSVSRDYLIELERRSGVRLDVMDSVELQRLLRRHPRIASRYFGSEAPATSEGGS